MSDPYYPPSSGPASPPGGYMKPERGTMILIFGVLGIVACGIFAFVAYYMGNADLRDMEAGIMDPAGYDNTKTGRLVGLIGIWLMVISLIFAVLVFGFMFAAIAAGAM